MRISYSRADTYRRCPQLYKVRYVDGIRPAPPPAVILGGHVHEALKQLHNPSLPAFPSEEQLIAWFQASWATRPLPADDGMDWFARGVELLRDYYARAVKEPRRTGNVEMLFSIPFEGQHQITGRIDRIDMPEPDVVEVIDYKTGRVPTQQEVDENLQLACYHMAARALYPMAKIRTTLYFLVTNFPMSAEFDDAAIERHRGELRQVIAGIEQQEFEPRPGRGCDYCDCRQYCSLYRRPEPVRELALDEARLGELARRYVAIEAEKKQARQVEKAADEALQPIRGVFAAYLDQVGRPGFTVDNVHVKRTITQGTLSFEEESVRRALEPAGLCDRVLEVSDKRVRELLDDPSLPADLRRALEACGTLGADRVRWTVKDFAPEAEDNEEE